MLAGHAKVDLIEVRGDEQVAARVRIAPSRCCSQATASCSTRRVRGLLEQRRLDARDVCFVIGGPKGLDLQADMRLSLGPMTLPHQLARAWCCSSRSSGPTRSWPASPTTTECAISDGRERSGLRAARRRHRRGGALRDDGLLGGPSSIVRRGPTSATTRPTPRCCSLLRWASSRRDRRAAGRGARRPARDGGRARGDRRAGLPQPVHDRRLVPRLARRHARRGRPLRRRRRRPARAGRVRQRQPDRADHRGRGAPAAFGDSLARILELAGNTVEREYYVNDAGTQVRKFGEAIRARARGEEPEEYKGEYLWGLPSASRTPPTATRRARASAASS